MTNWLQNSFLPLDSKLNLTSFPLGVAVATLWQMNIDSGDEPHFSDSAHKTMYISIL